MDHVLGQQPTSDERNRSVPHRRRRENARQFTNDSREAAPPYRTPHLLRHQSWGISAKTDNPSLIGTEPRRRDKSPAEAVSGGNGCGQRTIHQTPDRRRRPGQSVNRVHEPSLKRGFRRPLFPPGQLEVKQWEDMGFNRGVKAPAAAIINHADTIHMLASHASASSLGDSPAACEKIGISDS